MNLTFLSGDSALTKKYKKLSDGSIEKTSFLNAYRVTSYTEHVKSLPEFLSALEKHAAVGHCMVKGELTRELKNEPRAGSTDSTASTWWVCLDIDGLPAEYTIDQLMEMMGLGEFSYIIQWSASMGIPDSSKIRAHIFMLLAKPVAAPLLKQWLIQLNHQTPFLKNNLALSKTNMALLWGLDITACQNDKLIYIAPPILEGIKSPLGRKARYELVTKDVTHLVLPEHINTTETNKQLSAAIVADLRIAAKLPARKNVFKTFKDTEVLSKPDEATLTEIKVDRGFTYMNLNGGDSWAYYHPTDNPEIIYNFKGEPNYATKELLPDYYKQAKAATTRDTHAETALGAFVAGALDPVLLAFRDRQTSLYHHGSYDPNTDVLTLDTAKNEKQIRDFCMQHDMPIGDFVPLWTMVFDPNPEVPRIDIENRTINMYARTEYMRRVCTPSKAPHRVPKTINKLMSHMLAGDTTSITHFLNWLAFIVQKRRRPKTAWVLYGTEGTGKGMFFTKVIRPLFGERQTSFKPGSVLASEYNLYLKNQILVAFDEAHLAEMKDTEQVHAKMRGWITEPTISIRAMHANYVEVENFSAFMLLSNKPNVILLQKNDRRWNIGPFQEHKLELTDDEIDVQIPAELQAFYNFLAHYPVDEIAARTPLVSEDRDKLISTTTSSADDVAHALAPKAADMGFFLDQLPSDKAHMGYKVASAVMDFERVLHTLIVRTRNGGTDGLCKISRDELHTLFDYTVGHMPVTPNKFTKFLAHRHMHTEKLRIGEKIVMGVQVKFKDAMHFADYERDHFPKAAPASVKAKKA